jgi:hypothetical protein
MTPKYTPIVHPFGRLPDASLDYYRGPMLTDMVDLVAKNIYTKPDKPNSDWGILERARTALAKAESQPY